MAGFLFEAEMNIGKIVLRIDTQELLKADVVNALKGLTVGSLKCFRGFLFCGFLYRGLHVTPPCIVAPATGAGDKAVVCSVVWNREFIAAALLATESEGQVSERNFAHKGVRISLSGSSYAF
jgi:hypothetical protein